MKYEEVWIDVPATAGRDKVGLGAQSGVPGDIKSAIKAVSGR